jgi:hypothetical protein
MDEEEMVGGWVTVKPGRYRYSIDWHEAVVVKTVIWEYLATETRWERQANTLCLGYSKTYTEKDILQFLDQLKQIEDRFTLSCHDLT